MADQYNGSSSVHPSNRVSLEAQKASEEYREAIHPGSINAKVETGEIAREFEQLQKAIDILAMDTHGLVARIDPVLAPDHEESDADDGSERGVESALAQSIQTTRHQVESVSRKLRYTTNRVRL